MLWYNIDMTREKILNYRLYAQPSLIEGIASLMDIAGALNTYNRSETDEEADVKALANDWYTVGDDINNAIKKYELENNKK